MEGLDFLVSRSVSSLAGKAPLFDFVVLELFQLNTLKMMPLMAAMVWLWFAPDSSGQRRKIVFDGVLAGFVTLVVTRVVQNLAPHKPRPAFNEALAFVVPAGQHTNDWSSFPSDTAGLAFAIAAAIYLGSRRLGVAAFLWAIVVVSFPRLYGGYHYLSDLVAGAAIGLLCTAGYSRSHLSQPVFHAVESLFLRNPPLFYMAGFIVWFETSTYFWDVRKPAGQLLRLLGLH